MRAVGEPAVLRQLPRARAGRGSRQALLVRRGRQAPRGTGRVSGNPHVLNTYEVLVKGREDVAAGTMAFRFSKPAGFAFKAGQAVTLSLIEPPAEANSAQRIFSLASAPFEDELAIATRMRDGSAYKRALKALPPGAGIKLKGPRGLMTLHEDRSRGAVFIAGGIGITPFMSMLRQAAHDGLAQPLYLLYSNRSPADAPFLAELQKLAQENASFRLLARMTDAE